MSDYRLQRSRPANVNDGPSPEEIERLAAEIRAGWSEDVERHRRGAQHYQPLEIPRFGQLYVETE